MSHTPAPVNAPRDAFQLREADKFNGANWTHFKLLIETSAAARGTTGYLDGSIKRPATPGPKYETDDEEDEDYQDFQDYLRFKERLAGRGSGHTTPDPTKIPLPSDTPDIPSTPTDIRPPVPPKPPKFTRHLPSAFPASSATAAFKRQRKVQILSAWSSLTPSQDEWDQRDADTKAMVILNVVDPIGLGVNTTGDAYDAWYSLRDQYDNVSQVALRLGETQLRSMKYRGSTSAQLEEHFRKMRTKWAEVVGMGSSIRQMEFQGIILSSFGPEWSVMVSSLHTTKNVHTLCQTLLMHAITLEQANIAAQEETETVRALKARIQALEAKPQANATRAPTVKCTNCKKKGHVMADCFRAGGGKDGEYPEWWTGSKHTTAAAVVATPPTALAAGADDRMFALLSHTDFAIGALPSLSKQPPMTYLDSGATDNFFTDLADFDPETYKEFDTPLLGQSAKEGACFSILGSGTVTKYTTSATGLKTTLRFENSLYSPELHANLLSISKFDKKGHRLNFANGRVTIYDPAGVEYMGGSRRGGMYVLDSFEHNITAAAAKSIEKPANLDLWHRRIGHVGVSSIKAMAEKGLVDGLEITPGREVGSCEDCIKGKQTRRPFDAVVVHETEVLERVHIDLWGPARVQSYGGKIYMMLIIDGASAYCASYYLSNKQAATIREAFERYHVMAERQTGKLLKKARFDGGGEFEDMKAYMDSCGILYEIIAPYSSSANGVPERRNRTSLDGVRTMLSDSNLPKNLWAEAASTSVYCRNRVPSSRNPNVIPAELWSKKRQTVAHLRPFGCTAYAKLATKELGISKLDDRTVKCFMLGYEGVGTYCKILMFCECLSRRCT